MARSGELLHGTCVAFGPYAVLLRGRSGSGKSDLALRCLALRDPEYPPLLVADDQVHVARAEYGTVYVWPPEQLAGKMEVRGLGIVEMRSLAEAELVLICDLVAEEDVPRMPPEQPDSMGFDGTDIPIIKLAPFQASAALKVKLAVLAATDARVKR